MSVARMAHASAQRCLQSQLGPPLSDHASANNRAELWNLQTEKQPSHDVEKGRRLFGDSAGVGAMVIANSLDTAIPATTDSTQGIPNIDANLREQLLRPSSRTKQAVQRSTRKLDIRNPRVETRRNEDEISSEDDQGRSGIVRSWNSTNQEDVKRQSKKKKAKIKVETFESMQSKDDGLEKIDDSLDEEESKAFVPPAKIPTRPRSYLDEALEARLKKQQRKKMKKEK